MADNHTENKLIETANPERRIGENNTIVSADRIEELSKRAKEKLAQLNSGFDPEPSKNMKSI